MEDSVFELIYEETARPLWSYVLRLSGNPDEADDIFQETYLRFLRSPPSEMDCASVKPYLFKIATNLAHDRFRKIKRSHNFWNLLSLGGTNPHRFDRESEMDQVFARLKRQERLLLWLAYVEGYDHGEIAEILNIRPLSVRVLLFRARRRLATLMEKHDK